MSRGGFRLIRSSEAGRGRLASAVVRNDDEAGVRVALIYSRDAGWLLGVDVRIGTGSACSWVMSTQRITRARARELYQRGAA